MADSSTDIFDILHTTRAMRRLKPDPVPDELIRKILEAGIAAANGGNRQTWRFLVLLGGLAVCFSAPAQTILEEDFSRGMANWLAACFHVR